MSNNPTVLYFGIYDPNYARNAVLIKGLKVNGVEVVECRVSAKDKLKYLKLLWRFLGSPQFDLMMVGFPGQEIMFLARLLTFKPIIFDAFTSHYGGYILDRKRYPKNSFRARYYKLLDKWSCKLAQVVLLDTNAHIDFFVNEFELPREKFRRIWIGANDEIFKPINNFQKSDNLFKVIFFGTYIPLQGAEYIIRAAKILEADKDIIFYFIGKGQDKLKSINLVNELGLENIEFIDMMKPEDLRAKICESDIALGLFGDTPKTLLVIPNKIYEALAMGKPVITADTPAIRELFDDKDLFLVEPASPSSLADGIIKLKNDPGLRINLAQSGYQKFVKFASPRILGRELINIIEGII